MNGSGPKFVPWAVFWRTWYRTEDVLASLPMVVFTPIVGSIFGSAWAISHPAEVVRNGRVALVPQSFFDVLVLGLVGGALGIAAVAAAVFVWSWVAYMVVGHDQSWSASYVESHSHGGGTVVNFLLAQTSEVPRDPATLGALECVVKTPSGRLISSEGNAEVNFITGGNPARIWAYFTVERKIGVYEARWYATEHKSHPHEIARSRSPIIGP